MTLGKFIEAYLRDNNMSQRQFAQKCGMSSGYISMIVNGINPRSNTPIVPTLKSLNGIARGMNITIDDLFRKVDDIDVDLGVVSSKKQDSETKKRTEEFVSLFTQLTPDQQKMLIAQMRGLLSNN